MAAIADNIFGLGRRLAGDVAGGAARTTGRVAPVAGAGYLGYNWLEGKVGGTAAKFLLGASGIAIAYAAFRGIKSAVSNTANLVKKAAKIAIAGALVYFGASFFFNKSANAALTSPNVTTSALDINSAIDVGQLTRTLRGRFNAFTASLGNTFSSVANTLGLNQSPTVVERPTNIPEVRRTPAPTAITEAPDRLTPPPAEDLAITPRSYVNPAIPADTPAKPAPVTPEIAPDLSGLKTRRIVTPDLTILTDQPTAPTLDVESPHISGRFAVEASTPDNLDAPRLQQPDLDAPTPPRILHTETPTPVVTSEAPDRIASPTGEDAAIVSRNSIDPVQPADTPTRPIATTLDDTLPAVGGTAVANTVARSTDTIDTAVDTNTRLASLAEAGDEAAQIAKAEDVAGTFIGKGSRAIATELKNALAAAKGARLGGNIPLVGVGIGVSAAALTTYAFSLQRNYAEALHEEGRLTTDARDSYIQLSYRNQGILTGDIALSTVDPTGLSIIATLGAEGSVSIKNWMDKEAPQLSPEEANGLSMSLFTPDTVHEQLTDTLRWRVPSSTEGQPEELHAVIEARQELMRFGRENPPPNMPMMAPAEIMRQASERHQAWRDEVAVYRNNFLNEVSSLVQSPGGMDTYLNLFSESERLDLAVRLSKSDDNVPTEIRAYSDATSDMIPFNHWAEERALTEDMNAVHSYIKSRFQPSRSAPETTRQTNTPLLAGPV